MPPRTFNPAGRYKQRTQSRQPSTGRLTGYTQSGATDTQAAYTLDALGRTTQAVLTLGRGAQAIRATLQHTYTADGRRDSLTYPDGTIFRHTYQNGRLATAQLPPDHTIRWASYQWNQPTRIDSPGLTRRLDYDPLQRLTRIQVQALGSGSPDAPQGPVLLDHRYTYDPAGNITQQDTADGPYTYGYDALDRLTQATPPPALQQTPERPQGLPLERYSYDAVHNRQSSAHQPGPWSYNADNQLTQHGQGDTPTTHTYSPTGQRTRTQRPNHHTDYTYDAADRLRQISQDGQERATYRHDPFGRRIAKTVNGHTTYSLYANEGLIAELNDQGHLTRAYGWQPDTPYGTAPLWQAEISGTQWQVHVLQTDHLGTPKLATNSQGHITWQAQAEAFGTTTPDPHSAITVNLRFPGQYFDEESGLHYNYFRDYDPQTGMYIQSDPIGLEGGINAYGYAEGNPLENADPFGLEVSYCYGKIRNYKHAYVCKDKQCMGLMPSGPGNPGVLMREKYNPDHCKNMDVPQCDQQKYELCVWRYVNKDNAWKPHYYGLITYNCVSWAREVILICQLEACSK